MSMRTAKLVRWEQEQVVKEAEWSTNLEIDQPIRNRESHLLTNQKPRMSASR